MRSICTLLCGWKLIRNLKSVMNNLKSFVQKHSVNRGSRSLVMLFETHHRFTICLIKEWLHQLCN